MTKEEQAKEKKTEEAKKEKPARLEGRCFNIIDSVKGGSGKTSLTLMLSLAAQRYMQEQEEGRKKPDPKKPNQKKQGLEREYYSLLMDMDMQGSALDYLLFENSREGHAPDTLNDAVLKYYRQEKADFISRPRLGFSDNFGRLKSGEDDATAGDGNPLTWYEIAVALASKKIADRDRFRAISRMNYSSQITYDTFRSGLRAVLKDANLNSYLPSPPQYIFFDMPPNSNGYSDCVLELLLPFRDDTASAINSRYPRNYFELMTLDRGHIMATLDWFEEFVKHEQYQFPDHFFFVFSNAPEYITKMKFDKSIMEPSSTEPCLRAAIRAVWNQINDKLRLAEELRSRIYFVGIGYQEEYLRRCCSAGTLMNSSLDRGLLYPVNFLTDADGNLLGDPLFTDKLLEIMCTKP